MSFMIFLGTMSVFIVIGLFIWLVTIIYKSDPKPQDLTMVTNFCRQYTEGFSEGILIDVDFGEKINGYKFMPIDVDFYSRQRRRFGSYFRNNKSLKPVVQQTVYIRKDKVISFPRGTFSGERNKIWLLPPNPEDLPEEVKQSSIGKYLMKMIDDINNKETEVSIIREGADRVRNILFRQGDGEISSGELDRLDSLHDKIVKNAVRTEDKHSNYDSGSVTR